MKRFTLISFFALLSIAAFAQGTAVSVNISVVDSNNNPVPNHIVTLVDSSFMGSWYALTTNASGVINTVVTVPTPALGTSKQLYLITSDNCNNYYSTDTLLLGNTIQFFWSHNFVVCPQSNPANCNYTVSALPVAGFPNQAFFNFSGQGGSTYLWTFGDGTSSNQPNVFHTYAQAGTYTYCLQIDSCTPVCGTITVFNSGGCDPFFFPVTNGATVDIYPSLLTGQFQAIVDWGDGIQDTFTPLNIPSIPNTISHTYAVPGTYQICLTHSNAQLGCSNTACNTVIVTAGSPLQCNASFIIDTVNSQPGTVYAWNMSALTGGSAATIVNFIWDFGDGTTSNQPYPTHNYQNPGSYAICLTMTAVDSSLITCISTYCDSLTVDQNGNIIYKGALVGWNFVVLNPASIGIDESVLEQTKIYPNPAKDVLTIELPETATTAEARLFSVSGALVNVVQLQAGTNTLDVATLPTGLYVLHLKSDVATTQIKFVKE
jgi:PKD repeat protein